jgi:hypothetical protein
VCSSHSKIPIPACKIDNALDFNFGDIFVQQLSDNTITYGSFSEASCGYSDEVRLFALGGTSLRPLDDAYSRNCKDGFCLLVSNAFVP